MRLALQHELFTDALLMCKDDRALRAEVIRAVCAKMDDSSLTKVHSLVQSGMEDSVWSAMQQSQARLGPTPLTTPLDALFSSFPSPPLSLSPSTTSPVFSSWRAQAALCSSDPSPFDAAFLTHLGDYLWAAFSQPIAAHICYLISGTVPSLLSSIPSRSARVVLLGGDHRRSLRQFTHLSALQWTQVYEFLLSLQEPSPASQAAFCHGQVYKLLYAEQIADLGLTESALRYCVDIAERVKATGRKEAAQGQRGVDGFAYNALFLHELSVLEHRLRVALNAPASSPVRQKLVTGLFSVLDKGINLLVGDGAAASSNGVAQSGPEKADWGAGGAKWERPFAVESAQQQPLLTPSASGGGRGASPARPMHERSRTDNGHMLHSQPPRSPAVQSASDSSAMDGSTGESGLPSGFSLPSAVLPRSSSSTNLSPYAPGQATTGSAIFPSPSLLRTSRSGDNIAAAFGSSEAPAHPPQSVHAALSPAPVQRSVGLGPATAFTHRPLPALEDASTPPTTHTSNPTAPVHPDSNSTYSTPPHGQPTAAHPTSYPPVGHDPLPHGAPPTHGQPPAGVSTAATGSPPPVAASAGQADGAGSTNGAGLLRRLGSVGGLFSLWGSGGGGGERRFGCRGQRPSTP